MKKKLRARGPASVGAATDAFGEFDASDGTGGDVARVENEAFRRVGVHVGDEGDEVAVVFSRAGARRERCFTSEDAFAEGVALFLAGLEVDLHDAVEEEPARGGRHVVRVPVRTAGNPAAHHRE